MEEMCKGGTTTFSLTLDSNPSNPLRDQCHSKGSRDDHHEFLPSTTTIVSTPTFMTSLSLNSPLEALPMNPSSLSLFSSLFNKNKRVSEHHQRDDSPGDHRLKRRLKNRESAARSRARRQAYTSELEMELAQLTEENTKLREQQTKIRRRKKHGWTTIVDKSSRVAPGVTSGSNSTFLTSSRKIKSTSSTYSPI